MEFERQIKRKTQQKELERIQEGLKNLELVKIHESNVSQEVLELILYYVYNVKDLHWFIYSKSGILDKVYSDFSEMLKKIEFTEEEKIFIAYNICLYRIPIALDIDPIWSILFRRKLIEKFGDGSLEVAIDKLGRCKDAVSLLKMENWPNRKELEDCVAKKIEDDFLTGMNCGGFALCINTCFFPGGSKDCKNDQEMVDRGVSFLLENIPFIRLLGDTELMEDEYIVEYRASKTAGHHFIRIDPQGKVEDKNESDRPRVIEDITDEEEVWDTLANCPHAIFAVKIDHEIDSTKYCYGIRGGKLFEDVILECIKNSSFEFEYHNHNYTISSEVDGTRNVYSDEELVAKITYDESGTVAIEEDENREHREGKLFEGAILKCIKDSSFEFEYHNHNYTISSEVDGTRYVYSNGELVATIISDESGTVVIEEDEKREYISNTNSSTFDRYLEDLICCDSNEEKEEQVDESDDKFEFEL